MNLQERQQLTLFLQQLAQAQAGQKDAEADALIQDACARQPNAGYLLVQRAMQLEHGLQQTQAQVTQLQSELAQLRPGARSSFLDGATAWGRSPVSPAAQGPAPAAQASAMPPRAPAAAPAAGAAPSWGSGLLGNVATTAAGVVAGSFLFQGIENLMGHHGGAWGTNAGANPAQPTSAAENTTINNYYGSDAPGNEDDASELADAGDDSGGSDDLV